MEHQQSVRPIATPIKGATSGMLRELVRISLSQKWAARLVAFVYP
jgi:hypothetical protein